MDRKETCSQKEPSIQEEGDLIKKMGKTFQELCRARMHARHRHSLNQSALPLSSNGRLKIDYLFERVKTHMTD